MKRKQILLASLCVLLVSLTHAALATDVKVAGTWDLSAAGRDGNAMTQTLTLQQDGTKITGTAKGPAWRRACDRRHQWQQHQFFRHSEHAER